MEQQLEILSPHACSTEERMELLAKSEDKVRISRILLGEDSASHPAALREQALLFLDGTLLCQDLALALSCCVETCSFRDSALDVAARFKREQSLGEFLHCLRREMETNASKYLLLAIWGMSSLSWDDCGEDLPLELVDTLGAIAGREFLQISNKRELMGSWRLEAVAALALPSLGKVCFTRPSTIQCALDEYAVKTPVLRSASVICLLRECDAISTNVKQLLLCEAIEKQLLTPSALKTWNETWFWKTTNVSLDERVKELVEFALHVSECTKPLLAELCRAVESEALLDEAVVLRISVLAASLASGSHTIELPWKTGELSGLADRILAATGLLSVDIEEFRARLGQEKWKADWIGTPALLFLATSPNVTFTCMRGEVESHLLACLLPLIDDVDPRIAAPAWFALTHNLSIIKPRINPQHALVLHALEQNLTCRDEQVFERVCACYTVCSRSGLGARERKFVERFASDAFYSAHSAPGLYGMAISQVLSNAVERLGVLCVPILDLLLRASEAGAQRRETNAHALTLLASTIRACEPRIFAHRGRVFALLLRLSVIAKAESVGPVFASFQQAVARANGGNWIEDQLEKIERVNPMLAAKLVQR